MSNSPLKLSDCWAKTDPASGLPALTVRDHCLIVGAVGEALGFPTHVGMARNVGRDESRGP